MIFLLFLISKQIRGLLQIPLILFIQATNPFMIYKKIWPQVLCLLKIRILSVRNSDSRKSQHVNKNNGEGVDQMMDSDLPVVDWGSNGLYCCWEEDFSSHHVWVKYNINESSQTIFSKISLLTIFLKILKIEHIYSQLTLYCKFALFLANKLTNKKLE